MKNIESNVKKYKNNENILKNFFVTQLIVLSGYFTTMCLIETVGGYLFLISVLLISNIFIFFNTVRKIDIKFKGVNALKSINELVRNRIEEIKLVEIYDIDKKPFNIRQCILLTQIIFIIVSTLYIKGLVEVDDYIIYIKEPAAIAASGILGLIIAIQILLIISIDTSQKLINDIKVEDKLREKIILEKDEVVLKKSIE